MSNSLQLFEDNIRPANLLLRVYRLLDTDDKFQTEGQLVESLRSLVGANHTEDLMLVYNEIFLGLVREGAQIPRSTLKRASLVYLLRQAVVAACTGLDTYLPALLSEYLPLVIRVQGRSFVPADEQTAEYLKKLTFSLDETMRLLDHPNPADYISQKLLGLTNFSYLSSCKGVHIVGRLLGLPKPWDQISEKLSRQAVEIQSVIDETVKRRNDIVHRADRTQKDPQGEPQDIGFAWTRQSVDTIQHVCLALDELVSARIKEFQAMVGE